MERDFNFKLFASLLAAELKAFLYFPAWWYSSGLKMVLAAAQKAILNLDQALGFNVWLRNIFAPIYGYNSVFYKIASFLKRIFWLFFGGVALIGFAILALIFVCAWLVLPLLAIYQIIIHI